MSSPGTLNASSAPGINYALGGKRANTFRCGYLSAKLFVYADDVLRRISDLRITERNGAAASASFVARGGWEPQGGETIIIKQGTRNPGHYLFAGTILSPLATNFSTPENRHITATVGDWSWALNGDLVMGTFTGTYDEIALYLMARYAPSGFTTRRVQTGLPTVPDGIEYTNVPLDQAIERLAKRGGYVQFLDYDQDLYFRDDARFLPQPATVTADNKTLKRQSFRRGDYGQLITRVYFECRGSVSLADLDPGESIVPLVDVSNFPDTGGLAKSGTQRFAFSGVVIGGGGSVVGSGVTPTNAPNAALAAGSGVTSGLHTLTVVWKTGAGRTKPGPSVSISVGLVTAPSSAAVAGTPSSGGSMDAGSHRYYPVFRTAAGSTTPGPVSNSVTAIAQESAPSLSGYTVGTTFGGSLDPSTQYNYKFGYVRNSDGALTLAGPASANAFTGGSEGTCVVDVTSLGISAPSGFSLAWFRRKGGSGTYKRVTLFSYGLPAGFGGSDTYFIDQSTDGTLGADEPASDQTKKGTCLVTGIPVSPDALVTNVDLYREFNAAGASTAKLAFSVANGVTSASDTAANSSLGATVPSSNTATANQIAVSGIAVGPTGTTDREVYMDPAGGGTRHLALTIANNTDTTGTITISDATLAGEIAEPSTDTSGLTQPDGQVLPGDTSAQVAGTAPFQEDGGWAVTGTQAFRYEGFSGDSLTGIPASGIGSITQPINFNTTIAAAPCLIGVTSGSPDLGSITYSIPKGQDVTPVVQLDNIDAQALVRSKIDGHSGIKAVSLSNRALSYAEARGRGQVYLDRRSNLAASGSIVTKDINYSAGRTALVDLDAPTNVHETLIAQTVTISNFHPNPPVDPLTERPCDYQPDRTVELSNELISLDDLLRQDART